MSTTTRIDALHAQGLIDLHYDLGMDLYENRHERGVLRRDYLPDIHFVPGLSHHGHARNVTAKLVERGWRDEDHLPVSARQLDAGDTGCCLKRECL